MSVSTSRRSQMALDREKLCRWFMSHKRRLPWRRFTRDHRRSPYATWISEIMLQQTQVKTVVEYYRRWMEKFPDVKSLAAAREGEVLAAWAGLGYYTRARNLHRGAREVIKRWKGHFPRTREDWLSLPGVGPYTAGAVLSLAYNLPEPILDGNIIRIFSRYYGIPVNPTDVSSKKIYWEKAVLWAAAPMPQRVNESLMELGALVCLPGDPRCGDCPLNRGCYAYKRGMQPELPPSRNYAPVRRVRGTALVIRHGNSILLKRGGAGDWLRGQWMFPWVEGRQENADIPRFEKFLKAGAFGKIAGEKEPEQGEAASSPLTFPDVTGKDIECLFKLLKGKPVRIQTLEKQVRHAITHHRIQLRVAACEFKGKRPALKAPFRWLALEEVPSRLTNSLARKIWSVWEAMRDP